MRTQETYLTVARSDHSTCTWLDNPLTISMLLLILGILRLYDVFAVLLNVRA
jgi:hypothetical protein